MHLPALRIHVAGMTNEVKACWEASAEGFQERIDLEVASTGWGSERETSTCLKMSQTGIFSNWGVGVGSVRLHWPSVAGA